MSPKLIWTAIIGAAMSAVLLAAPRPAPTPAAGPNASVQVNGGGSLYGDANFTYDGTYVRLTNIAGGPYDGGNVYVWGTNVGLFGTGQIQLYPGAGQAVLVGRFTGAHDQVIILNDLPQTSPGIPGQLWDNGGFVAISR